MSSPASARPMRCVVGRNYRKAMSALMPALVRSARIIMSNTGKLTANDVARLAVKFELPCKTAWEFLEYAGVLPSGHWERLSPASQAKVRAAADRFYRERIAAERWHEVFSRGWPRDLVTGEQQ